MQVTVDYRVALSVTVDTETGDVLDVYVTADDLGAWPEQEVSFFIVGVDDPEPGAGHVEAAKARAIADRISCAPRLEWEISRR